MPLQVNIQIRGSLLIQIKVANTVMSRKGDCYNNAPMESFWGILKTELVHHRGFKTRQQAIQEITEYIEIFYNRQRKQERLGYLSPVQFSQQYYANLIAA